jgi:peptide/nickel transport system permease protein
MVEYIIKRILLFIPTLFIITLISFSISRLAPGDPAALKVGAGADGNMSGSTGINPHIIELVRKQWNLDKPVWQQYVIWMGDMLMLDFRDTFANGQVNLSALKTRSVPYFGDSFQDNRPVLEKLIEFVPVTLFMNIAAVFLAYIIAIPLGIYSATHQGSFFDKLSTILLFALYSLPIFWVGTLAITFLCNYEFLSLFPSGGLRSPNFSDQWSFFRQINDYAAHLVLPMIIYTYGSFAYISRQMRSAMLETVRQDYIRTARAKGLSEKKVIFVHALRNSLIPIITLLAGILPGLIGGSVIIETIFSVPGMGELSFKALVARDYPMIMAVFTISAVLTLVGILISDLLYSIVDPRIAYSKKN